MAQHTLRKVDLADEDQFKNVLFQMSPDNLIKVISIVELMKEEVKKRLQIRDALEQFVLSNGLTLKNLSVTKTKVDIKFLQEKGA